MALTPAQFLKKWTDTHTELSLSGMDKNKSTIKTHPSDKNISCRGKIPGKNIIEKKCFEDRRNKILECLCDAFEVRAKDLVQEDALKIADRIVKFLPQKVEQDVSANFTFADMIHKASLSMENYQTIDVSNEEKEDTGEHGQDD